MEQRGRPKKYRVVRLDPRISQFSPRGRPGRPDETDLNMDEFEAIRLADFLGMGQKEASKLMSISQQTFSRIIKKAHKKVADILVNGKAIKIQGGPYVLSSKTEPLEKPQHNPHNSDSSGKKRPQNDTY